jgi:hypothetical protein
LSQKQLKDFLNMLPKSKNKLDQKETIFFQSLNQYAADQAYQTTVPSFVADHAFANRATAPQPMPQPKSSSPTKQYCFRCCRGNHPSRLQQTAALLEKELKEAKARKQQSRKS